MSQDLHGLYAITPTGITEQDQLKQIASAALRGGARIIQYRDKQSPHRRRLENALMLRVLCNEHGALLIINDDAPLALEVQADGVHVGRQDTELETCRNLLGRDAIIGVSCYNQLSLARAAQEQGADYVAFGRFFPSNTKPHAVQADPQLLTAANRELRIPVVAIGGITPENGARLITAGADMLAVIDGIFGQPDIETACRRIQTLFARPGESIT